MIIRLWALAWAARYLKYVPLVGWRFSDTIVQTLESRMDRDVTVESVSVDVVEDELPTDLSVAVAVRNELPVAVTVAAVNLRLGYSDAGKMVLNFLWSEEAHGDAPVNVSRSLIESEDEGTVTVERRVATDGSGDRLHLDGSLTIEDWLDVPAAKRLPLGTLERDLPAETVEVSS